MKILDENVAVNRTAVAVIGFWGRGNCGDEALFQCIYEAFVEEFDVIACVDEVGARDGWQEWYPYNSCTRIHQGNIHFFEGRIGGLIVGGGGLGLGFGASQCLVAKGAGTPVVLVGTDSTTLDRLCERNFDKASLQYMELFDYVALRNERSVEIACIVGKAVHYGADWALRLKVDESNDLDIHRDRVLITLREWPLDSFDQAFYVTKIRSFVASVIASGRNPVFAPFSPEDETFLEALGLNTLCLVERCWWNPRRMKQLIAASGMLISVGRLHPMIFAISADVPCIQVQPPLLGDYGEKDFTKMQLMAEEFCVSYLDIDTAADRIRNGQVELSPETRAAVAEAEDRLNRMTREIKDLFHSRGVKETSRIVAGLRQKLGEGRLDEAKADYRILFAKAGVMPNHILDYLNISAEAQNLEGVEEMVAAFVAERGHIKFIDEAHLTFFRTYAEKYGLADMKRLVASV